MISFWVSRNGSHGIRGYLDFRGRALAERFVICHYEDLAEEASIPAGAHILAGLDELTPRQRELAAGLHHQLAAAGACVLNDPRQVRLRYQLLTTLFERGLNQFTVARAVDADRVQRFPVFVREDRGHNGALTGLLQDGRELQQALTALRARGNRLDDLLIVEFCDTIERDGTFRKYAAFKVGEAILPVHVFRGREWMLKSGENDVTLEHAREERVYIEQNPHEGWLRSVFELARVDFGRIDYGIRSGVPQAWEINTNPTIGRGRDAVRRQFGGEIDPVRERSREAFHARLRSAFATLDDVPDAPPVRVRLDRDLLVRARREAARACRRQRLLTFLRRCYAHPVVGWPARAAYARLLPLRALKPRDSIRHRA